jgi:ferredoxin
VSGDWRVTVDRDRCIGSGMCTGVAPEHFVLVDGKSTPTVDTTAPAETVTDAADFCPAEAITVRSVTDGQLIAPEQ